MILRDYDGNVLITTQPDHAELSGQLASYWGNDQFAAPDPFDVMVVTALEHDNGWRKWDNRPTIDPKKRFAYDFINLPTINHLTLYRRGIYRALNEDPYMGLLVSMHGVGLYNQRYGTDTHLVKQYDTADEKGMVDIFIAEQGVQQKRLRESLSTTPGYKRFSTDNYIWANYKLLQVWDKLSVYFCLKGATDVVLNAVPLDYNGKETTLTVKKVGENAVNVSPYPFSRSPLTVSLRSRLVPKREFADDKSFRETYYRSERVDLRFTINRITE